MQPGITRPAHRGQSSHSAYRAQPQRSSQRRPVPGKSASARPASDRGATQGARGRAPQPGGRAAAEQRAVRRFHGEQAGVVLSHSSVKKRHNASYSSESPDDSSDGSEEVDGSPEGSSGSSSESTISMGVPGSTSVFGSRLWSMTVPLL